MTPNGEENSCFPRFWMRVFTSTQWPICLFRLEAVKPPTEWSLNSLRGAASKTCKKMQTVIQWHGVSSCEKCWQFVKSSLRFISKCFALKCYSSVTFSKFIESWAPWGCWEIFLSARLCTPSSEDPKRTSPLLILPDLFSLLYSGPQFFTPLFLPSIQVSNLSGVVSFSFFPLLYHSLQFFFFKFCIKRFIL